MNLEIAAFHECGHAVAAMASRFHSAPLALTATTSGHGDAYFGPSARKLRDAGKPADQSCVSDPEVAREAALICFAGLAAEKRRCQEMGPPATADAAASWADDKMARNFLADAGVSLEEEQELRASAEAVIAKDRKSVV